MYKNIIIALGLEHGHGSQAIEAARKLLLAGGKIVAVHVLEEVPGYASYYLESDQQAEVQSAAEKSMHERIGDQADIDGVILVGHPGRTITEYAEQIGADCVIVGSHKPELQDYFLGSTAARIVRHAPCAVHVLR